MNLLFKLIIPSLFISFCFGATLSEDKARRISKVYKNIFEQKGYSFKVLGSSFDQKDYEYEIDHKYEKAFLVWSGESLGPPSEHRRIDLLSGNEKTEIVAEHFFENYTQGKVFLAISSIKLNKSKYRLSLKGKLRNNPKFFGHAIILLKKNNSQNKIKLYAGLEAFYPGSLHGVNLQENTFPQKIAVIGGHGLAGNGSTNLLNGKPLGKGDDWNGSAGKRWDIDLYRLSTEKQRDISDQKVIFEVDPLLQWLFPLVIIGSWSG